MTKPTILFCNACGAALSIEQKAARHPRCELCEHTQWQNPKPVAVLLQPVYRLNGECGLLTIKRGIEPFIGGWAFPSGFVELGETAAEAAVREFQDETCIPIPEKCRQTKLVHEAKTPGGQLLLFIRSDWMMQLSHVERHFQATDEATDYRLSSPDDQLCFPLHWQMLMGWHR